jgi:hypothetical protein
MPEITDVTLAPCNRPSLDELAGLESPYRPFPDGNGWYAHYLYRSGGSPAYKRLTHGDHDDLWYRVVETP